MSHRSRRKDDRDWSHSSSHSSHKYDKYEHRHRRDDSRDRSDHYHSRDRSDHYHSSSRSEKSRSKYRSRSRSPSYGSKGHSRHHRSRSRSQGYSSRHNDKYQNRSHRSKDHKELPESKQRDDSREHSQTKHIDASMYDKFDVSSLSKHHSANPRNEYGSSVSSYQNNESSESHEDSKSNPATLNEEDAELEEEKQRIQKETLARLQKHLEKEGKLYPPPKPQASHPIFANDGSFLEMFKTMQGTLQQQRQQQLQHTIIESQPKPIVPTPSTSNPVVPLLPVRKRGAKILKTGIVQKQRVVEEADEPAQSNDSWNAYLKEVKRYKTVTCSDDTITRSLVK